MQSLPLDLSKLREIFHQHDIAMLGVFGSSACGEATDESDIDFLVRSALEKFAHHHHHQQLLEAIHCAYESTIEPDDLAHRSARRQHHRRMVENAK